MRHRALSRVMCICLLLATAALAATVRLRVTAEIANVREKPDIGSNVVRQVPKGTLLESSAKEGDWYLVILGDESGQVGSGYVHESLVALVAPEEGPQTPAATEEPAATQPVVPPPQKVPVKRQEPVQAYAEESLFDLALSGGGILVLGGDLNRGARGLADFYLDSLNALTGDEVDPIRLGLAGGGEISFPLAEKISLGVGVEYLRGSRQSLVYLTKGSDSYSYTARPALWAIPLRAFLAYAPVPFIRLKIGVEYVFAHASYYYRWEAAANDWQEWRGDADARALGVFGALGLEWSLSPNFGLILELGGRYAPLNGFNGTGSYLDSEAVTSKEEGKLYYYETHVADAVYSLLFIRSRAPSEAGVYNPRPAEVDFTGAALRAGLKLKF